MTDKSNLLLLFDRPAEPIFLKKGEDNATFDLPESYWVSIQNNNWVMNRYVTLFCTQ